MNMNLASINPMTFQNISVCNNHNGKYLVRDISDYISPGSLTAVIGASNSGANILLQCLGG